MSQKNCKNVWVQSVTSNQTTIETFLVLLAALIIIAISATVIFFNQKPHEHKLLVSNHEISLRYDLKPSEQGIYSDLLLVYQDLQSTNAEYPSEISVLVEDDWPPFTDTIVHKNRGSHLWQKKENSDFFYYLGTSQDTQIARHFLWLIAKPTNTHSISNSSLSNKADNSSTNSTDSNQHTETINVWLYQGSGEFPALGHFHDSDLAAAGWRKINASSAVEN